jgi:hypothetical protein
MYPQPIVHKALSWGAIRKSACILAEITIRKSQGSCMVEFYCYPLSLQDYLSPKPWGFPPRTLT